MTIAIKQEGRRLYVEGDSYPIKDRLKTVGCKWDGGRKQWWIGSSKRTDLEKVLSTVNADDGGSNGNGKRNDEEKARMVIGKAQYKGRTYRVVWAGPTKRGLAAKLCYMDGTHMFWADCEQIEWVKQYDRPKELEAILRFAEGVKNGTVTPREPGYCYYPCPVTGLKCCPENGPCHDCQ